jgi:hypothetical protein
MALPSTDERRATWWRTGKHGSRGKNIDRNADHGLTAIDSLFMICSYGARRARRPAMDNRISEIRKQIRTLRISMIEAEAIMRGQINRDENCAFVAGDILKMRTVMSVLVRERTVLGDREPILVNSFFVPRRAAAPRPVAVRPVKSHLVPAARHAG